MEEKSVIAEFIQFLRQEKKYWIIPIVILFVFLVLLVLVSESNAVGPFIYRLF